MELNGSAAGSRGLAAMNGGGPSLYRAATVGLTENGVAEQNGRPAVNGNANGLGPINENNPGAAASPGPARPRRPASLLHRSQSEYGPRQMQTQESAAVQDAIPEWGARHGFEDHYQSEQISQLANVGFLFGSRCLDTYCRL